MLAGGDERAREREREANGARRRRVQSLCLLRSVGGRPARMGGVKTPVGGGDATPTLPCVFRTAPGQFRLSRLGIVKNSPACATQCAMAPARLGDFKSNQKKERRNYGHGNECARRRHCGVGACTTQHSCRGGGARSAAQVGRAHGLTFTLTLASYSSYVHYSACCPAAGGPAPLGSNRPSSPRTRPRPRPRHAPRDHPRS
jgi:hypothetical protein